MSKKQRRSNGRNKGHDNIKGQGFHTNPERINKSGRPVKLVRHFNERMKEKGYEPLTDSQLADAYKTLLQLPQAEIKRISLDETEPFFLQLVANLMGSKRGMEMLDRILDRSFGRPKQYIEASVTEVKIEGLSPEQIKLMENVRAKLAGIEREDV